MLKDNLRDKSSNFLKFLLTYLNKTFSIKKKELSSNMRNKTNKIDFVNSIQKAFLILESFTQETPKLKFKELLQKTKLPKATLFRYINTLKMLNYIVLEPEHNYYFPSPKVMSLGFTALSSMDLREIAAPFLKELSSLTMQNVNLGVLDRSEVVIIERIKKRHFFDLNINIGSRLNVFTTAIGRAILAFLSQEEFNAVLNEILKDDKADKDIDIKDMRLIKLIEEVRQKGYALNNEEFIKGLRAIAAPIFNSKGNVDAAINIPVFVNDLTQEDIIEHYVPLLLNAADKISISRGFNKP